MAEQIKNIYNYESIHKVAVDIQSVYHSFKVEEFMNTVINNMWDSLELKERIYHISTTLGKYLPSNYGDAISIIDKVVMNYGTWLDGFVAFFPIFIELYGQDEKDWDISVAALARYTPYASSEIAIRPFIIKHEKEMMEVMYLWSKHADENVRRLASEGCRPALPWAPAIVSFKKDPTPILAILEQLKADPSLHVRKSVANNLNDISKTHPDLVLKVAKEWYGQNKNTDWIVKHACRTLLKQGNPDVLAIFGYNNMTSVNVSDFALDVTSLAIGDILTFSFIVAVEENTKVRLEYGIDYMKANGKQNRKIFQISEVSLKANHKKVYAKRHSFADGTTRKHYAGNHSITLIVNGVERGKLDFILTK